MDDWLLSEEEVEQARKELTQEQAYKHYLGELATVARTPAGANVICALLQRLGVFDPTWSAKNAHLARAVVLNDFGQELLNDLAIAADDVHDDIQRMMRIRRKAADVLLGTNNHGEES